MREAVSLYSDALADCPPHHTHLLYTNRAAARLTEVRVAAALPLLSRGGRRVPADAEKSGAVS